MKVKINKEILGQRTKIAFDLDDSLRYPGFEKDLYVVVILN